MNFIDLKYNIDSDINCSINLPASKSISNRALILNALSGAKADEGFLSNLSDCDDTEVMLKALRLGNDTIDIGAAGTSMRFLTALLSITKGTYTITGSQRMKERPIGILVDALRELGAEIQYAEKDGYPPLIIKGKQLKGGEIHLNGSVSSQYISALLMIAPKLEHGLILHLTGTIISRPYIDMTLSMMNTYGINAKVDGDTITIPHSEYKKTKYTIEPDWSAASYWYEALALKGDGKIFLPGLTKNSLQGDSAISQMFKYYGVTTTFTNDGVVISNADTSTPNSTIELDFSKQPDMAQTFVVLSCFCNNQFRFTGLQSLKIKETDRIFALITELQKFGFLLHEDGEGVLTWEGDIKAPMNTNPSVDTYKDHRMAMAFAPAVIKTGSIRINDPAVVSKSYPHFWKDLGLIL